MSKKTWIIGGAVVVALIGATVIGRSLTGDKKAKSDSGKVTTLKVAHTQNYVPYDFVDKDGNSDGYEVAVLKEIDKKLPQYKFEYTGTSDDDLLIGLESGKYDIGTKGAWYTDERAKKFIIPKDPIGASIIGLKLIVSLSLRTIIFSSFNSPNASAALCATFKREVRLLLFV